MRSSLRVAFLTLAFTLAACALPSCTAASETQTSSSAALGASRPVRNARATGLRRVTGRTCPLSWPIYGHHANIDFAARPGAQIRIVNASVESEVPIVLATKTIARDSAPPFSGPDYFHPTTVSIGDA